MIEPGGQLVRLRIVDQREMSPAKVSLRIVLRIGSDEPGNCNVVSGRPCGTRGLIRKPRRGGLPPTLKVVRANSVIAQHRGNGVRFGIVIESYVGFERVTPSRFESDGGLLKRRIRLPRALVFPRLLRQGIVNERSGHRLNATGVFESPPVFSVANADSGSGAEGEMDKRSDHFSEMGGETWRKPSLRLPLADSS
jgi:hypothetical protein